MRILISALLLCCLTLAGTSGVLAASWHCTDVDNKASLAYDGNSTVSKTGDRSKKTCTFSIAGATLDGRQTEFIASLNQLLDGSILSEFDSDVKSGFLSNLIFSPFVDNGELQALRDRLMNSGDLDSILDCIQDFANDGLPNHLTNDVICAWISQKQAFPDISLEVEVGDQEWLGLGMRIGENDFAVFISKALIIAGRTGFRFQQ